MNNQTQTLIRGAMILTIAGIAAKLISAFYKIPLTHFTGTLGLSYYMAVYPIYSLLTAAALIGIPNSVSKLVAEELVQKEYNKAHQTFRISFVFTVTMGFLISIALFVFSDTIVELFHWDNSYYALLGLSFAPFFISISGAIRGYLQGMQTMVQSGVSQIIENIFKVLIGIGLVVIALNKGLSIQKVVGGAALGVSAGLFLSAVYLSIVYLRKRKSIKENIYNNDCKITYSKIEIAKKIAFLAVPVTIASASYSIMTFIDNVLLPKILTSPVLINGEKLIADGKFVTEGSYLIGVFGKIQTVINVPLVISVSLIISIVPSISAANALLDKDELRTKIREATEMALKLALPAAVGILILAEPILKLLYGGSIEGGKYLKVYAFSLVFMILAQSIIGILQGLSRYYTPLFIVIGAAIIKVFINTLLLNSSISGYGALIGTLSYYVFISVIGYYIIKRQVDVKQSFVHAVGKPLTSSIGMGIVVYFAYIIVHNVSNSNIISTIISVIAGIGAYGTCMLLLRAFTKDELTIIPKHAKFMPWLEKHNLIKIN